MVIYFLRSFNGNTYELEILINWCFGLECRLKYSHLFGKLANNIFLFPLHRFTLEEQKEGRKFVCKFQVTIFVKIF